MDGYNGLLILYFPIISNKSTTMTSICRKSQSGTYVFQDFHSHRCDY